MSSHSVAVIDYGMGNILSVCRALEHCGASVTVSKDPRTILSSNRVILPGVGAFADAMVELCRHGMDDVIREVVLRGTPLLGICLGMQMLLDESAEFGTTEGLGLISGRVVQIPSRSTDGQMIKIPNIGWNALMVPNGRDVWGSNLLQEVRQGESVYFVHSFMADVSNSSHLLAESFYGGISISAVIGRENIFGCQFHPEKSGEVGLRLLKKFIKM